MARQHRRTPEVEGPWFEPLEPRQLLSSAFTNVNITRSFGSDNEPAIAINRTDTQNLFAASNLAESVGLNAAYSFDGGDTWTRYRIADGNDQFPVACCDPSLAWDDFGNLYLSYLIESSNSKQDGRVVVLTSTDGGQQFSLLAILDKGDQPSLAVGPGREAGTQALWVTYATDSRVYAQGAEIRGLGVVNGFFPRVWVPSSSGSNFGDITIGPAGEVAVTFQSPASGQGPSKVRIAIDPDGLGPLGFGKPIFVTSTNVGGFDEIPAQPRRTVDAEAGLAWDRSNGPNRGRLYLIYTDERGNESNDLEILLRRSDDNGQTWSDPIRVNDDATSNSQFLPRLAIDQTIGDLAAVWYDARDDKGNGAGGDSDGLRNNEAIFYGAISIDGGVSFGPNVQIAAGSSAADLASPSNDSFIEYGDYSGLDFFNGYIHPIWADNSTQLPSNPDLDEFDLATAVLLAPDGLPPSASLDAASVATASASHTFTVTYTDNFAVNVTQIDSDDLRVTGPNGFDEDAQLIDVSSDADSPTISATYRINAPDGAWSAESNGIYLVALKDQEVFDSVDNAATGGTLGVFAVNVGVSPAITVESDGLTLPMNGSAVIDFGQAVQGDAPVTRTLTFRNVGDGSLVVPATALPLGYSIVQDLPLSLGPGESADLVLQLNTSVRGPREGELTLPGVFTANLSGSVVREVTLTGGGSLKYVDRDGVTVTVSLSGPRTGAAVLRFFPEADDTGLSSAADLESVTLSNTTLKNSLKITVAGGGNTTTVRDIDVVGGDLGAISASRVNLDGDIAIDGVISSITLRDIADNGGQHHISIAGLPAGKTKVKLAFARVFDLTLAAPLLPIASFTAIDWTDAVGPGDALTSTSLGTLTVKGDKARNIRGDMNASVLLTLADNGVVKTTLAKVSIAGRYGSNDATTPITLRSAGNIGGVTMGGLRNAALLAGAKESVTTPTSLGDFSNPAARIGSVTLKGATTYPGLSNSVIAAGSLGTLSLKLVDPTDPADPAAFDPTIASGAVASLSMTFTDGSSPAKAKKILPGFDTSLFDRAGFKLSLLS